MVTERNAPANAIAGARRERRLQERLVFRVGEEPLLKKSSFEVSRQTNSTSTRTRKR